MASNHGEQLLVFLPGMMCDQRLFGPQIEYFGTRYDIRIPSIGMHDTIAAIAACVFDELPRRPIVLCGLSMGGIVAMEMICQQPDRIEKLILMDTNHRPDAEERKSVRRRQIADVEDGKLRPVIIEEMKPNYLAGRNRDNQDLLDLLFAMAMDLGDQSFINQSRALMARGDASQALKAWTKPALLICGAEDELCTPQRHEEMLSLLPESQLEVISGAGHITTLEAPEHVNSAIENFMTGPGIG